MIQYQYECGHSAGVFDAWSNGPDRPTDGMCIDCRAARIGQRISFVRHGAMPDGASLNHRDGTQEDGISVYEINSDGQPIYCGWHFAIAQRPAIYGAGEICGWGSDGEPLVRNIHIQSRP